MRSVDERNAEIAAEWQQLKADAIKMLEEHYGESPSFIPFVNIVFDAIHLKSRLRRDSYLRDDSDQTWRAVERLELELQLSKACEFCGAAAGAWCTVRDSSRRASHLHSARTEWVRAIAWPADDE